MIYTTPHSSTPYTHPSLSSAAPSTFTGTIGPYPTTKPLSSVADEVLNVINAGYNLCATGSRVTKNFDPLTSDYDFAVFDWDKKFKLNLPLAMWEEGGSGNLFSPFISYKRHVKEGCINFIVVDDKEYYRKYVLATELIKKMNPPDKAGRIALFDLVFKQDQKDVPF